METDHALYAAQDTDRHRATITHTRPTARTAWLVCIVLSFAYALSFLDRGVLGVLAAPMEADLMIGDVRFSLLQGFSFAVFYAGFGLPVAYFVDTRQRGLVIAGGIFVWSVATILCGVSQNFAQLFLCRVLVGVGEATLLPGATSVMRDCFPPQKRGLPLAVFATGLFVGSAASGFLASIVTRYAQDISAWVPVVGALHPWRMTLIFAGLAGLPTAVIVAFIRVRRSESVAQNAHLLDIKPLVALYREKPVLLSLHHVGFTAICFASYALSAWIPLIFVRQYHWSLVEVGQTMGGLALVVGPAGSLTGGVLADFYARRGVAGSKMLVALIAAIGMSLSGLALSLVTDSVTSMVVCAIFFFFSSFVWGLAPGLLQDIVPPAILGRVTALYTAIVNLLAMSLGPLASALLARQFSGPGALSQASAFVAAAGSVLAALLFWSATRAFARFHQDVEVELPHAVQEH
ncbi:MFS transporter [Acetobacter sp.]|uniref:MFS transporter n=1 Tax=Acetobacter sp. TaxID=440 RepID=UPI0039E8BBD3